MVGLSPHLVAGICIVGSLVAAAAPIPDWQSLVKEYGFPIVLVVFFVWANFRREERTTKAAAAKDAFIQRDLVKLNRQNVEVIASLNATLREGICSPQGSHLLTRIHTICSRVEDLLRDSATLPPKT